LFFFCDQVPFFEPTHNNNKKKMERFFGWEMMVGAGCLVAAAWEKAWAHKAENPSALVPCVDSQQAVLGLLTVGAACATVAVMRPMFYPWILCGTQSQIFHNGVLWDGTPSMLTPIPVGCACGTIEAILVSNLRLVYMGRRITGFATNQDDKDQYDYSILSVTANILNIQEHTMLLVSNDPHDVETYLPDGVYLFRNMDNSHAGWLFEKHDRHITYKHVDLLQEPLTATDE